MHPEIAPFRAGYFRLDMLKNRFLCGTGNVFGLVIIKGVDGDCFSILKRGTRTSVIYFGMTRRRAETFRLPQPLTQLMAFAETTPDCSIWPLYVGVQSVGGIIETEAQLNS